MSRNRATGQTFWIALAIGCPSIFFIACGDESDTPGGSEAGESNAGRSANAGRSGNAGRTSTGGDGNSAARAGTAAEGGAEDAGAAGMPAGGETNAGRGGSGRGGNAGMAGSVGGGGIGGTLGGTAGTSGSAGSGGIAAGAGGTVAGAGGTVAGAGGATAGVGGTTAGASGAGWAGTGAVCSDGTVTPPEVCDHPFTVENCGDDCGPISPTPCTACIAADPDCGPTADCSNVPGFALAGEAAGWPRADLCRETLDCIRDTECAAALAIDCYCGTATPSQCTSGMGNGACRTELERGLETTNPNEILTQFSNPELGGGFANIRISCEQAQCPSVCGF